MWVAATAASTSSSATTTLMRISEVEIMPRLTPAWAMAEKNLAVTPGWLRMPAPISETLPTLSS